MFYILYRVTNNLNGKIYVGVHKTKSLDDGYMGSGKVIQRAIAKYGVENFTRVILEQFDDSAAMYAREKEVVTEEFLARDDTYNLRRGGFGGFDYINREDLQGIGFKNPLLRKKAKATFVTRIQTHGRSVTEKEAVRRRAISAKENYAAGTRISAFVLLNSDPAFQEKRKAAFAKNKHAQGERNSQFGTKWITNGVSNKKIKKDDLVPEGWIAGRTSKNLGC